MHSTRSKSTKRIDVKKTYFVSKTPVCKAYGCSNMRDEGTVKSFFRFPHPQKSPLDRALCQRWLENVQNETLPQNVDDYKWKTLDVVCQDHFTPDCFRALGSSCVRLNLKRGAVPTLVTVPVVDLHSCNSDSGVCTLDCNDQTVRTPADCEPEHVNEPLSHTGLVQHKVSGCHDTSSSGSTFLISSQYPEASRSPAPEKCEAGQFLSITESPSRSPVPSPRACLRTHGSEWPASDPIGLPGTSETDLESGRNVSEPMVMVDSDLSMEVDDALPDFMVCRRTAFLSPFHNGITGGEDHTKKTMCASSYGEYTDDENNDNDDESDENQPGTNQSQQENGSDRESGCICEGDSLESTSPESSASLPVTSTPMRDSHYCRFIDGSVHLKTKKGNSKNVHLANNGKTTEEVKLESCKNKKSQVGKLQKSKKSDWKAAKLKKVKLEREKLELEIEVLKLRKTNAKIEQLIHYYRLRKLEQEMGVAPAVIDLDMTIPEAQPEIIYVTPADTSVGDNHLI